MKPYPGFLGGSARVQGVTFDQARTVNWYLEPNPQGALSEAAFYPTPGFQSFVGAAAAGITDVGGRAIFSMNTRTFAVIGGGFYELFQTKTVTRHGSVAQDNNLATISYNGAGGGQLFITSGGNGYLFTLATNTLTTIAALTGKATMGAMLDGYFIAFDQTNSKIWLSNLLDGATWDTTQFAQRSIAPDLWQACVIGTREIWLIGEQTGEVWYDAGSFPFPFAPIPGAFFKFGTPAPFSVAAAGDSVIWLSKDALGAGQVVQARGYTPQRISDYALETAISGYQRTSSISDAEALVYQQEGHTFYVLRFPTANATWVYDLTTGVWHERGSWSSAQMRWNAWKPRVHGYAFGQHLTGESTSGTIATMDVTYGSELDGSVIRRQRIGPPIFGDDQRLFSARFHLVLEPGLGLASGQGSDPTVMLRLSKDGKTWGTERTASAGKIGVYGKRVYWTRNGSGRLLVPEVTVTDPIPWRLAGALIGLDAQAA